MNVVRDVVEVKRIEEVQDAILSAERVLVRGGGAKPALSAAPAGVTSLDLRGLRGITEYQPSEFTISALAGTPVAEIESALLAHGQYLPFDPPLVAQGATVGGVIGAGLNGPLRYRYGGLRDFLIGVRFVDGRGRLVRGGGKVVKNAAGFDLPKLLVGSIGRLGVIVEATFKVFPRPDQFATVCVDLGKFGAGAVDRGAALLRRLATAPLEIHALDLAADDTASLWIRVGGARASLADRVARLCAFLGAGEVLAEEVEADFWEEQRSFAWAAANPLLARVPTDPHRLHGLDDALRGLPARRRYSVGGHVAWFACDVDAESVSHTLRGVGATALLVRGRGDSPLLGAWPSNEVIRRLRGVLDPNAKFLEF